MLTANLLRLSPSSWFLLWNLLFFLLLHKRTADAHRHFSRSFGGSFPIAHWDRLMHLSLSVSLNCGLFLLHSKFKCINQTWSLLYRTRTKKVVRKPSKPVFDVLAQECLCNRLATWSHIKDRHELVRRLEQCILPIVRHNCVCTRCLGGLPRKRIHTHANNPNYTRGQLAHRIFLAQASCSPSFGGIFSFDGFFSTGCLCCL